MLLKNFLSNRGGGKVDLKQHCRQEGEGDGLRLFNCTEKMVRLFMPVREEKGKGRKTTGQVASPPKGESRIGNH